MLNETAGSGSSSSALDAAIESGNWEAVAASAAAIVKQNESANAGPGVAAIVRQLETGDEPMEV